MIFRYILQITLPKGDVLEYISKDMGHIKSEMKLFKDKYENNGIKIKYHIKVETEEGDDLEGKIKNKKVLLEKPIKNKSQKIKNKRGPALLPPPDNF